MKIYTAKEKLDITSKFILTLNKYFLATNIKGLVVLEDESGDIDLIHVDPAPIKQLLRTAYKENPNDKPHHEKHSDCNSDNCNSCCNNSIPKDLQPSIKIPVT